MVAVVAICCAIPSETAEAQAGSPGAPMPTGSMGKPAVLSVETYRRYVDTFNQNDSQLYAQHIPNAAAWDFLKNNIPLLDCPDGDIEEIYYFRWWTFRKHIKQTPDGFVITEFLPPVPWAGKHNTISCAAGHHLREGRWLNDPRYLDDYSRFWFRKGGDPRRYSFWAADAIWSRYQVTGDDRLAKELLPDLVANYEAWEKTRRDPNGLFWQVDGQDGMEVSISGALNPKTEGYRATINSYMYGDACAIARIAERAGQQQLAERFRAKAAELRRLVQDKLWDSQAQFFKVLPRGENTRWSDAREEHGYTPWYFDLPDPDKSILWDKTGERYHRGGGLRVLADGKEIASSETLKRVTAPLPPRTAGEKQIPTPGIHAGETTAGWVKYEANPIIGGQYGTCFDVSVLKDGGRYRMWLSWRPKQSLALVESKDGIRWSEPPQVVLGPRKETGWEDDINRPVVVKREDGYHLFYTGQAKGHSAIGYATSPDGIAWKRMSDRPVLSPEQSWEKVAVMCPHVLWDAQSGVFRMWYSGGEQNEPNAIGYATSTDGLQWTKHPTNPVFTPDPNLAWEKHKVTACQVERVGDWYVMFYIGFRDEPHAQIGIARSRDGITNWQRHPANPIIRPGENQWDHDACYKPYAIYDGSKWLLWYNGRHGGLEQIGVVFHPSEDLGF